MMPSTDIDKEALDFAHQMIKLDDTFLELFQLMNAHQAAELKALHTTIDAARQLRDLGDRDAAVDVLMELIA